MENEASSEELYGKFPHLLPFGTSNKPLGDLKFLAVHSNSYIEGQRDQYRNIAKAMNTSYMCLQDKPTYSRPLWPFQLWHSTTVRPNIVPDVFLSKFDSTFDPHAKNSHSRTDDILTDILQEDNSKINHHFIEYLFDENTKSVTKEKNEVYWFVVNDVKTMMKNTFDSLEKKHQIFQNYSIIEMGSMGEGTKVGNPDEFDFMVELPRLNETLEMLEADRFTVLERTERKKIKVNRRELFSDFEDLDMKEEKDEDFLRILWNQIQLKTANSLKASVLRDWKWLDTVPGYISSLAQTQTLLWQEKAFGRMIVHIDICICFKPQKFDAQMNFNQETLDETRPGIKTRGERSKVSNPDYLLLLFDGQARWTHSVQEKQIWCMFSSDNGRKIVYRCLKFMILQYLPKRYNEGLFRLDPLIPSYWLKTILFYLMIYFHEDEYWVKGQLAYRFVEVFLILRKCLLDKNLSSFFVPHNVLSKYYSIFSSKEPNEEMICILTKVNELYKIICSPSTQTGGSSPYTSIVQSMESSNKLQQDQGLFKSVIELCYFYAYNEFNEENWKALQSFVDLFLSDDIVLKGEGEKLEVEYRGLSIDINSKIAEYYKDTHTYFK